MHQKWSCKCILCCVLCDNGGILNVNEFFSIVYVCHILYNSRLVIRLVSCMYCVRSENSFFCSLRVYICLCVRDIHSRAFFPLTWILLMLIEFLSQRVSHFAVLTFLKHQKVNARRVETSLRLIIVVYWRKKNSLVLYRALMHTGHWVEKHHIFCCCLTQSKEPKAKKPKECKFEHARVCNTCEIWNQKHSRVPKNEFFERR